MKTRELYATTMLSVILFFGLLAALIFGFAGTVHFGRGWAFWAAFCLPTLGITLYFLQKDPALIERRIKPAETRPQQIVGQSVAALLFFFGLIGFPAFMHRRGQSHVPFGVSVAADAVVVIGFVLVFFVFRENTFTSRAIEHMEGQRTVTTGPYGVVRHPMYTGAALIILAAPPALGDTWGLIASALLVGVIVFRLLDEEKYLKETLEGYREYCARTPYRLVPFLW